MHPSRDMDLVRISVRIECVPDVIADDDLQDQGRKEEDTKGSMRSISDVGRSTRELSDRNQNTDECSNDKKERCYLDRTMPDEDTMDVREEADQECSKREQEEERDRHHNP